MSAEAQIREALAAGPTPGPWKVFRQEIPIHFGGNHIERRIGTEWNHPQLRGSYPVVTTATGVPAVDGDPPIQFTSIGEKDAAHIAACNPAAMTELLATIDSLRAEMAGVRAKALEEAALACENEKVDDTGEESDYSYNMAIRHVADAIRALPKGSPDGMGGFAPTQETAIVLWNARPALASRLQEREGQPAPVFETWLDANAHLLVDRGYAWHDFAMFGWHGARATLAAGSQAVHVPGWRWVPVEPTKEMIDAGAMHTMRADEEEPYRARGEAIAAYCDMLDAAPQQPLAGGEVTNG